MGRAALDCPPGRRPGSAGGGKIQVELCSTGQPRAAVPTCFRNPQMPLPCQAREVRDFHRGARTFVRIPANPIIEKPACFAALTRLRVALCTKSCQSLVDGLHSIEKSDSYNGVFSIDEKNKKSRTRLFFDSFLSFSGWCGVRGSSGVTFLIERSGRRVSKGL